MPCIALIGSAGRKQDAANVCAATFDWMVDTCRGELEKVAGPVTLVSGGAAFADHCCAALALEKQLPIVLELPAAWDKAKKCFANTEAGRISNFYHRQFSKACGKHENESLIELDVLIRQPNTKVVVVDGFFQRNSLIAERCDQMWAFTFHEPGPDGPTGGTGNTWRKCNKPKRHFVIPRPDQLNALEPVAELEALESNLELGSWPAPSAELMRRVDHEYSISTCYPPREEIFTALKLCPLETVKVVIIGQDPYHGPNQAHGLAFSVKDGKAPPSLINIFQELKTDLDQPSARTVGNLEDWASQGVLLLNSVLTVKSRTAASHAHLKWDSYTDELIKLVSTQCPAVVFMLWGGFAQKKRRLIDKRHLILTSAHPSPLSAHSGFFGCKHFSKANQWLEEHKLAPIKWQ